PAQLELPSGLEQTETASDGKNRRNQRDRDRDGDRHAHRARDSEDLERRQPGKAQTVKRSGDRQSGGHDDLGDSAESRIVSRFPIFASLPRFLISPDEKYPVVRSSGDYEGYEQIDGEGRETNNFVMA